MHSSNFQMRNNKFEHISTESDFRAKYKQNNDKNQPYSKTYKNVYQDFSPINNSIENSMEDDNSENFQDIKSLSNNIVRPILNNNFNTFNQSAYENSTPDDEILKLKLKEIENDANEKQKIIENLNKKLNAKNHKIQGLESKNNQMQEIINQYELNFNHLNNVKHQLSEAEKEIEKYRFEVGRLHEALASKDSINREFQNLAKETMVKFDYYDMTNNELLLENKMFKKELKEFRDKIREIYRNKNFNSTNFNKDNNLNMGSNEDKFDIDVEILVLKDFISQEIEREITKINNDNNKDHIKIKEEFQLEHAKVKELLTSVSEENSFFKKENFQLKKNVEEIEKELRDKDFQFKLEIENKNREIEQSISAVRNTKKQIKDIENEYKLKLAENINKLKIYDEKERKLINEQEVKHKQIYDASKEIDNYIKRIKSFEQEKIDLERRIEELEEKNKELNSNNEELIKSVERKNNEVIDCDDKHEKELGTLFNTIDEMKIYHQSLLNENEELKFSINALNQKVKELADLIEKYQGVELALVEERNNNEGLNKTIKELNKRLKVNEEKYYLKINKLKKEVTSLEETIQNLNCKYDEKIKKISAKLEKSCFENNELVNEVQNLRNSFSISTKQLKQMQNEQSQIEKERLNKSMQQNFNSHTNRTTLNDFKLRESGVNFGHGYGNDDCFNYSVNYPKSDLNDVFKYNYMSNSNEKGAETIRNVKNLLSKIDSKLSIQHKQSPLSNSFLLSSPSNNNFQQ